MGDKLHSGKSYNAVGHEFKVNEPTIPYIQKKEEEVTDLYVAPETAKVTSTVHHEATEKLEIEFNLWVHEKMASKKSIGASIVEAKNQRNLWAGFPGLRKC